MLFTSGISLTGCGIALHIIEAAGTVTAAGSIIIEILQSVRT